MPTAVVFDLKTALVATIRAAVPAGTNVYDGLGNSADPGKFVMVGVGDPNADDGSASANGTLEWAGLGHRTSKENGTILCCAVAWSGDTGSDAQQRVREDVRDISAAIEASLRTDPNLGGDVPGLNWVRYGGSSPDAPGTWSLQELAATDGVACVFRFEIAYFASLSA